MTNPVNAVGSPFQPMPMAPSGRHQCVFCLEDIQLGASVCPHCGSNLAPLQAFADKQAALEERIAVLEAEMTARRPTGAEQWSASEAASSASAETAAPSTVTDIKWPHMVDNLLLGLAALLAAHWLATTLPESNRAVFRLVALVVALPFGFQFERNSRSSMAGRILAALAFASTGILAIGLLDIALAMGAPQTVNPRDVVASVATIALSHFAGSALAFCRRCRAERAASADSARMAASSTTGAGSRVHIEPDRVKGAAEAIKALYEAVTPLAAGAAALWAALGHHLP